MTREEKDIIFNLLFELEERHSAFAESVRDNAYCEAIADVKLIIEGIKEPSLPANVDEAANNYGVDIRLGYPRVMDETDRYIYNAFKAGAEWMAWQGETVDGEIVCAVAYPHENKVVARVYGDYKFGDKVIVQIRKK